MNLCSERWDDLAIERVPTGITELDRILQGGLPQNSMILIAGGPGTGKSILAAQFLFNGVTQFGERSLHILFGESADTFKRYLETLDIDFTNPGMVGKLEIWECPVTTHDGIDVVVNNILEKARTADVKRLVIDSITALTVATPRIIDVRVLISLLQKVLRTLNCTTILIAETPWERQGIGTGVEEFIADGIILLQLFPDGVELRRRLAILKMRGTDHSMRYYRFTIAKGGITIIPYPET